MTAMQYTKIGLPGPHRPEKFNLKQCSFVLGLYGVITIISYFNELAKSGLLYGTVYHYPAYTRSSKLGSRGPLIERVGDTLNLDVAHLKNILDSNMSRGIRSLDQDGQINIAVHLGRNTSYETSANNSGIQVISYKNVMPNFFRSVLPWETATLNDTEELWGKSALCKTLGPEEFESMTADGARENLPSSLPVFLNRIKCRFEMEQNRLYTGVNLTKLFNTSRFHRYVKEYSAATKVFLYQHEIGGYAMRDCFRAVTRKAGLHLLSVPLNQAFRQEWDFAPEIKRSKFQALYGSLSFGVCENIKRPCLYATMMTHPLDRILQVYFQCRQNDSHSLCNLYRSSNITQGDVSSFIKATGNSYFKKLLYHTKQCRLIGEDEICIQDGKASFVVTPREQKAYLQNVLRNLENWFAVIGLIDRYEDSLELFEYTLGLNFTACPGYSSVFHQEKNLPDVRTNTTVTTATPKKRGRAVTKVLKSDIKSLRTKLLNDSQVLQWLYADLAIYEKAKLIFHKQWAAYENLRNVTGGPQSMTDETFSENTTEDTAHQARKVGSDGLLLEKTYASNASKKAKRSTSNIHTQPYQIKHTLQASRKRKRLAVLARNNRTAKNAMGINPVGGGNSLNVSVENKTKHGRENKVKHKKDAQFKNRKNGDTDVMKFYNSDGGKISARQNNDSMNPNVTVMAVKRKGKHRDAQKGFDSVKLHKPMDADHLKSQKHAQADADGSLTPTRHTRES